MPAFPEEWFAHHRPLILGHRGASHAAPQNTLKAFRLALEQGADGVELDVHLSRDGVPVVIHDARVDAHTNGHGAVAELTLAELKALDAGEGERIPTLEEVLTSLPEHFIINVELKSEKVLGDALERTVAALVRRIGATGRVWYSSFNPFSLRRVRAVEREVPCGFLYDETYPPPVVRKALTPFTPHEALHPHHPLITAEYIQQAHARGLRVYTWTLDDVARARELAAWGIDGIITNEPDKLLRALGR